MRRKHSLILAAAALLLAGPALAQDQRPCFPAQPCPNGPRVPFPVVSPVQGLNSLTQRVIQQREQPQQPAPAVPWNYVPTAIPPQTLPPQH
jgi:hypothetical protein